MISRLPWRKKLRTSAANNLDKINELIDYINHSDISPVTLSDGASGTVVDAGTASSMKALQVYGQSVQDGVPSPDAPVPVEVVQGRNLANISRAASYGGTVTQDDDEYTFTITNQANSTYIVFFIPIPTIGEYYLSFSSTLNSFYRICVGETDSISTIGNDFAKFKNAFNTQSSFAVSITDNEKPYLTVLIYPGAEFIAGTIIDITSFQLEKGSTPTPYVPYGNIGIDIDGEITPIDLQGNVLASLPDGTRDVLNVDSAGRVWIDKAVGVVDLGSFNWTFDNSTTDGTGNVFLKTNFSNNENSALCSHFVNRKTIPNPWNRGTFGDLFITNSKYLIAIDSTDVETAVDFKTKMQGVMLYYKLATPTEIELGYIDPPAIPSGSVIRIDATLTPEFVIEWWSYQEITEIIADLKAYVDWKVSQIENADELLGSIRLEPRPATDLKPIGDISEKNTEDVQEEENVEEPEEIQEEETQEETQEETEVE